MISVVLVNWNGWADTISCIQSLLNSTQTPSRIVVVDNASTNESLEIFRSWDEGKLCLIQEDWQSKFNHDSKFDLLHNSYFLEFDDENQRFSWKEPNRSSTTHGIIHIFFVKGPKNGGFGYGCNIGMKLAKQLGTDAIWLLNNDCIVSPDALLKLHSYILKNANEIIGTHIKYFFDRERFQAVGGGKLTRLTGRFALQTDPDFYGAVDYIHGASIAFPVNCLEKVGFFDQKIFMYCEEVDYCLRAASAGYKFNVLPVDIFHKEGGSQGSSSTSNAWTHVLINKHYVLKKNIGWGVWVIFFFSMLVIRSLLPLGDRFARQGARRALAHFVLGKAL
jgi:GT2 family glycosyltransferase